MPFNKRRKKRRRKQHLGKVVQKENMKICAYIPNAPRKRAKMTEYLITFTRTIGMKFLNSTYNE